MNGHRPRPPGRFLLFLCCLLAACAADNPPAATPRPPAATLVAARTATVTMTRTAAEEPPPTYTPVTAPATFTPVPTATRRPSRTPSATPRPTLTASPTLTPTATIPPPVAALAAPPAVTTVLLLGNDNPATGGGRTDTMIVVAVNRETQTAALLSLPRDLFVYIPGWQMARLNTAVPHGGVLLLKETLRYNFGLEIDYYARVGFDSFRQIVNALGGVEVAVSCALTDWRLTSPELDPNVEENWAEFTLGSGVHTLDGDLALWYVRSRRTTNDFERNRRQQQVLRAMFNRGLALDLLPQLPSLWAAFRNNVETDLDLATMAGLAALAPAVRDNGIQHLNLGYGALASWREPETGQAVQLLNDAAARPTFEQLFRPPVLNRTTRPPILVEVATHDDVLYRLAADNLAWYGFVPVRAGAPDPPPAATSIVYYGPNLKGAYAWLLTWLFARGAGDVTLLTGESYPTQYRVFLGPDYVACRPHLASPPSLQADP